MPVEREWVSIRDPDDDHRRYTFDVSFLLSGYRCIYGRGCQGIATAGPDEVVGCCVHGAYLTDEDDAGELARLVDEALDATTMEYHAYARRHGAVEKVREDGELQQRTRTVDGACVFLNRAAFGGGAGCALHRLALARGEHPMTYKPVVCWQLPLHRTIEEQVADDGATLEVHTIAAFERGHWGEGGADFHWWCTEAPAAFTARRPLYVTMAAELKAMVGATVYTELCHHLDGRRRQRNRVSFLPLAAG